MAYFTAPDSSNRDDQLRIEVLWNSVRTVALVYWLNIAAGAIFGLLLAVTDLKGPTAFVAALTLTVAILSTIALSCRAGALLAQGKGFAPLLGVVGGLLLASFGIFGVIPIHLVAVQTLRIEFEVPKSGWLGVNQKVINARLSGHHPSKNRLAA